MQNIIVKNEEKLTCLAKEINCFSEIKGRLKFGFSYPSVQDACFPRNSFKFPCSANSTTTYKGPSCVQTPNKLMILICLPIIFIKSISATKSITSLSVCPSLSILTATVDRSSVLRILEAVAFMTLPKAPSPMTFKKEMRFLKT